MAKVSWLRRKGSGRLGIAHKLDESHIESEMQELNRAGVETLVSFRTAREIGEPAMRHESEAAGRAGIRFKNFAIEDHGAPPLNRETIGFFEALQNDLAKGESIVLHCNKGVGRSGLGAAAILVLEGASAEDALKQVKLDRHRDVPDNRDQEAWVRSLEAQVHPFARNGSNDSSRSWLKTLLVVGGIGIVGVAAARAYMQRR